MIIILALITAEADWHLVWPFLFGYQTRGHLRKSDNGFLCLEFRLIHIDVFRSVYSKLMSLLRISLLSNSFQISPAPAISLFPIKEIGHLNQEDVRVRSHTDTMTNLPLTGTNISLLSSHISGPFNHTQIFDTLVYNLRIRAPVSIILPYL